MKQKYEIKIWTGRVRAMFFDYTEEELEVVKQKLLVNDKSFEIWVVDEEGWKSPIYKHITEKDFYTNKFGSDKND